MQLRLEKDLASIAESVASLVLPELTGKLQGAVRPAEAEPLLIGAADAAKLLSISSKTLWNHTVPRGDIPCVTIGTRVLYSPPDLKTWIEREKAKGAADKKRNGDL